MSSVTPYCLDCIREKVADPKIKAGGSSYCTHHVYKRTQSARVNAEVRGIITLLLDEKERTRQAAMDRLTSLNRKGQYRIPHTVTYSFAKAAEESTSELRELGLEYKKGDPQLNRIREQIEEQLLIAFVLRQRRYPTVSERVELHSRAHPHYERDMEELTSNTKYRSPSSTQQPVDDGYVPSWARADGNDLE